METKTYNMQFQIQPTLKVIATNHAYISSLIAYHNVDTTAEPTQLLPVMPALDENDTLGVPRYVYGCCLQGCLFFGRWSLRCAGGCHQVAHMRCARLWCLNEQDLYDWTQSHCYGCCRDIEFVEG
jgi:hypothetical protein